MKAVCVPFVLLLMFHLSQAQFTVQPVSVVQAEGVDAVFECLYLGAVSHSWGINGTFPADNEFQPDFTRTQPSGDTPATLTIPATAHYNNTVVQCRAVVEVEGGFVGRLTENTTLTIFAITVNASNDTDVIILSWADFNFTTNLMYCVNFNKITIVCNKTLPPVCGLTETQYTFKYPNHSGYDTFFFTVTPVDGGNQMKGTASEPVAGSFTSARGTGVRTVVSQGEDLNEKLVMFEAMVPGCTRFVLYRVEFGSSLVGSQNGTLNASGNVSITFSLPTDILTNISVTITAANGIDLMFENSLLSTSDIQRLLPETDCSESISMCGRIEYAVDSFSPGALMYLVPTTSESSSIMLAVRRGDNFSIGHIPPGIYSLLAFDLENNSLPRMPFSLASTSETVEVRTSRGTAAPVSDSVRNITVKLLSGDVEVNCSIPVTNCLVLVHSINSPEQLFVQLINFTDDRTIVFSVDFIGNVTVAVLIWVENNSIFEGQLSLITQLEIYTAIQVVISPSGGPMAGQSFSLTCSLSGGVSLQPTLSYQWTREGGSLMTSTATLNFDTLYLSDAGQYSCQVILTSSQLEGEHTVAAHYTIEFMTLNIQLRLDVITNCEVYIESETMAKASGITNRLSQGVEGLCACGFSPSLLTDEFINCFDGSSSHVTYRAVLTGTETVSAVELISLIEQWISDTSSIIVQSTRLGLTNTCPVVITDRDSLECPEDITNLTTATTSPTESVVVNVGAVAGWVVAGVLAIAVLVLIILLVLVMLRQRRSGSKDMSDEKTGSQPTQLAPVVMSHLPSPDYEGLSELQEEATYEVVDQPRPPPPADYQLSACAAYASTDCNTETK
ncbi:uncharacterized protein LOC135340080 isoform X2 [Halichondria panicea]|uniref:uncharacterized protein LOC135340080 isoform X2 n=1 Tax=Halichondria panicea TaxID=6063 RepID=UPI00312BA1E2